MRIGQGFDAHRLIEGRPLMLGGVHIPYPQGLEAHSDGDVVIHSLCDALLGAVGLGDIGTHFPNTDPAFENINSRLLLKAVKKKVCASHHIVNVDITIMAEQPKLAPFILQMRQYLAEDLEIAPEYVSVKATSTEGMGFTGRQEGIAAMAIVLVGTRLKQ